MTWSRQSGPSFDSMKPRMSWRTTCDGVRSSRRQMASSAAFFFGSINTLSRAVRSSTGGCASSDGPEAWERLAGERDTAVLDEGGGLIGAAVDPTG